MMEFDIRYAYAFNGEMDIWVDEREMELFLTPCDQSGDPDEKFRMIISKNLLTRMGIDWRQVAQKPEERESLFRVVADHQGLRIVAKGGAQ